MEKKNLAKSILLNVQRQGTEEQKQEAKKLLDELG
jgi:FimV-like protein